MRRVSLGRMRQQRLDGPASGDDFRRLDAQLLAAGRTLPRSSNPPHPLGDEIIGVPSLGWGSTQDIHLDTTPHQVHPGILVD